MTILLAAVAALAVNPILAIVAADALSPKAGTSIQEARQVASNENIATQARLAA
ncbi:hypothetical protein [Methylobacterium segetis]|uniref:hypothetical protein n=1 Tax=Methylobacterium segetis TaxID=2488750 RepID=UPI0014052C13|nr:hypothetical protein [Methylobacterium segetis]